MALDIETRSSADLERVYRETGSQLWRALYAYTRNAEIADEALAEAFAQALRRGSALRKPGRWVWSAAFRIAAGELKAWRQLERAAWTRETSYEMPETVPILSALARLSPRQRGALLLRYYMGYSTSEVAEILDTSAAAVRVHLMRGRRRLRQLLTDAEA
ncbi:MAG: RNA polymerase sigma factor [bacterium]